MSVLLTYFDEVRYDPPRQPHYWLGGITVDAAEVRGIEAEVSALAQQCFGSTDLVPETEFHASALINRRDHFKEWTDTAKRIATLRQLLLVLDQHDRIAKIEICLDPARMISTDVARMAFMFLTEKVEGLLQSRDAIGLLIGDRENDESASSSARALSGYRARGTPYTFGRDITRLIDTVHFTHSHLSRMLQLADLYTWVLQFCSSPAKADTPQYAMQEYIRSETRILQPHKYKSWPTDGSWIQLPPS